MERRKYKILVCFFLISLLLISVLFIEGCSGGKSSKKKIKRDKARTKALERDANVVRNESLRTALPICTGTGANVWDRPNCAEKGEHCKTYAIADEPADCDEVPTLECVCPEQSVCIWRHIYSRPDSKYRWRCTPVDEFEPENP